MHASALSNALHALPESLFSRPLIDIEANPVEGARAPLSPGQIVTAVIVNQSNNGQLRADIDGFPYDLCLPAPAQPGQILRLQVLTEQPQLVFRLLSPPQNLSPATPEIRLSDTVRWLISAQTALPALEEPRGAPEVYPAPLIGDPTASPAELADRLRDAVAKSGLFYESHQALWSEGRLSLDALRAEPQAALATDQDNDAQALSQRQLAALAGGPIEWVGQSWPEQEMRLFIQRDEDPGLFSNPALRGWQMSLSLDLPRLGHVEADVHLSPAGARIAIRARDANALGDMRAATKELTNVLDSLGVKTLAIGLHHGE